MSRIFETLKNLKRSGPSTLVCPRCGSPNVKQTGSLSGWLTPAVYACGKCGYTGSIIIEVDDRSNDKSKRK
jgi:ribosomal protein S27AE